MSRLAAWRRWWKAIARWFRLTFATHPLQLRCCECGQVLTHDEAIHYVNTCNACEGDLMHEWSDT